MTETLARPASGRATGSGAATALLACAIFGLATGRGA